MMTIKKIIKFLLYKIMFFGEKVYIKNNCSISMRSKLLAKNGEIYLDENVWIGGGATVLDGIIIKKGCVIGAGSVVTKNTEEYGIYVGNPARKIGNRE